MTFSATIKQLRQTAKLSQQELADAVGVARATYVKIENGDREPKLKEIQAIGAYYQINTSDLIDGQVVPSVNYERPNPPENDISPREIDPKTRPDKLRQVLLYVLAKVGAKPNVGETVLYKLLYFIDMDYYEKTSKSITGLTYVRNHFGPTPAVDFKAIVTDMQRQGELDIVETKYFNKTQKKYLPIASPDLDKLTASELRHINQELARLSDKTASELSQFSHYDTPWLVAKPGQPIDYRSVFYRTNLTAVTEPGDDL